MRSRRIRWGASRYLVHVYFAKEHGWLIKGLEPHGMQANMSEVHEMDILQDRAPALVETLLEARQMDRGLSLDDVVVMIAALERLIFDESLKLLEATYALNDLSVDGPAVEGELHEVLRSYLLIFQMGVRGALDETVSNNPRVRIANFLLGPSNCIASSSYYSVCCLSECEVLMNELEEKVQAPMSRADRLLDIVANLTSSSYAPEAPRQLPEDLKSKMHAIGERHGGEVPLHGRLFAQWMHSAFPQECPYPHVHETAAVLSPGHWSASSAGFNAPKEERERHVEQASNTTWELREAVEAQPQALEWSDDEVLPLLEPPKRGRGAFASAARLAVQLAMLCAVFRAAYGGLRAAAGAAGKDMDKRSPVLPLHM